MRKIFFLLAFAACINNSHAQFIKIGPKIGANLQKINGQSFSDGYQLGYYAGAFAEIKLGNKWQLQPELLFNETKFDQSNNFRDIYHNILSVDSVRKIKLSQISIPILLSYKIANILAIQAGPQFSINTDKNKTLVKNAGDAFTSGDVAAVAGVQVSISKLRISVRYAVGLTNLKGGNFKEITSQDNWKSQTVQLGLGFVF